ncbi:uracil-DNA glycosylase [Altererythrobacter salegens]|uniref:Type-5 uracil-DNA glycosylase n=1 Tax=Croceibacterium salegens TaxID=1737568 RepID=A0A6I4SXD5_9SPHN|nr:uracil-DNA glycosylase [Croceibacterium salegens]
MPVQTPLSASEPPHDCRRCRRLVRLRETLRAEEPDWWNAPVPAWGDPEAWLAIVGLAPGRRGANRTGRPFTGDGAGYLLFAALADAGLARGTYRGEPGDGLVLEGAMILNAVKCLPPSNKPTRDEFQRCSPYLSKQLAALPSLEVVLAIGKDAHEAVLRHHRLALARHPFAHSAVHHLPDGTTLLDSLHCSRYNVNTGRLTAEMFAGVFRQALALRR